MSGAAANRENNNGHEMVAVCQRRPGDGSQLLFSIQAGKCTLWALDLSVEHWQCPSRAILELFFWTISLWGDLEGGRAIKSGTRGCCAMLKQGCQVPICQCKLASGTVCCCEASAGWFSPPFWAVLMAPGLAQPQAAGCWPATHPFCPLGWGQRNTRG